MTQDLEEVALEALQQRLLEEIEAQRRLQSELKMALGAERELRLENELLWVYLQRTYPGRIDNARGLRNSLIEGGDLAEELEEQGAYVSKRTGPASLRQRARRVVGKLPGVRQIYHGLKKPRKSKD